MAPLSLDRGAEFLAWAWRMTNEKVFGEEPIMTSKDRTALRKLLVDLSDARYPEAGERREGKPLAQRDRRSRGPPFSRALGTTITSKDHFAARPSSLGSSPTTQLERQPPGVDATILAFVARLWVFVGALPPSGACACADGGMGWEIL